MGENSEHSGAVDGLDGYEMSAAIDPYYELLLAVALYCFAISFLFVIVVKGGRPRRFSRLIENAEKIAAQTWGKVDNALRLSKKNSKDARNNTEIEEDGNTSVTSYRQFDECSSAKKNEESSTYKWPGLCNLVNEMMTIHKLAAPWLFTSLVSSGYEIAVIFLISYYIGEDDAIAYAVVKFYLYMFHLISYGISDAFYRNANVAIGSGNESLVGHQTNISMLFSGVASLPAILFSLFWMEDLLQWLGFSDYIAATGHDYAKLASCLALFDNVNGIWWSLLDLTGHEYFSAGFDFVESASGITLTAVGIMHYDFSIWELGLLNIAHSVAWAIISLPIIACVGWLKPYYAGIFSMTSLANSKATNDIIKTAFPLILVSISLDLEWRILSLIIDKAYGPAEVAAWILLDYVWSLLETWTDTFADAAQQIVTNYLYSGSLNQARATTNATLVFGFLYACLESLVLVLISDWLVGILTADAALSAIMKGLIPYLALGNPFVSIGTIASSLNESQGKYWVGLCFYWLSSLFITIPVAAVLSFALNVNVEAIAAAVVIGCTTSGLAHVGLLVESDYDKVIANWQGGEGSDRAAEGIECAENRKVEAGGSDTGDDSTVGGSTIASDASGGMTLFREATRLNVSAAATDIDGTQIDTPVDLGVDEEIVGDFDEESRANYV